MVATFYYEGLAKIEPFKNIETSAIAKRIEYELNKLAEKELLPSYEITKKVNGKEKVCKCAKYSCHSFRHYFAERHYEKHKDIEVLRRLLNHEGINTTQIYLQSLGIMNE